MRLTALFQSTVFRLLLGLALFIAVLALMAQSFDIQEVIQTIKVFPLTALLVLLLSSFLVNVLKGARFHVLVKHVGIDITFWKTLRLFLASLAATPIPAGETIRGALLKQETGASLGRVTGPVLGQAIYEIAAAALIVFAGSWFYPELFVPSLIAVVVLLIVFWILLHRPSFDYLLEAMSRLSFIDKNFDRIRNGREYFRHNFALLEKGGFDRHVMSAIGLALIAQVMGGLLVAIAAHAFDVPINFFQAMLVYASGALLQGIFTIIPAGLGVTEGGMSGILHLLGIDLSVALAMVIIIRVATLLFPVMMGIALFLMFYAKRTFFRHHKHS